MALAMAHGTTFLYLQLLLPFVTSQQSPGTWTMNATIPTANHANSGCLVLAQLTLSTNPPIIQAMMPICPNAVDASHPGTIVTWPIAENAGEGQGVASSMAIYADVQSDSDRTGLYDARAGCVMSVSTNQVQYLLGRSLTWENDLEELWDGASRGFVLDGLSGGALTW